MVYLVTEDKPVEICEIRAVGARADGEVDADAVARARDAARTRPEFATLVDVVERLGRLASHIDVARPGPRRTRTGLARGSPCADGRTVPGVRR